MGKSVEVRSLFLRRLDIYGKENVRQEKKGISVKNKRWPEETVL